VVVFLVKLEALIVIEAVHSDSITTGDFADKGQGVMHI